MNYISGFAIGNIISHFCLKTTYTHLKTTNLLMLAANKNVTKLKTV